MKGNRPDSGFTYVSLLVMMAVAVITMGVVGQTWKSVNRVEKERQLLWVGHQFRQALGRYYEGRDVPSHAVRNPATGLPLVPRFFPSELKDLLKDPRSMDTHRYLRKIYKDPMTGKDDWVVVMDDKQHIKGIHSASDERPQKTAGFDLDDASFAGKGRYSEWIFEYKAQ